MKTCKRLASLLLVLAMVFSMIPANALFASAAAGDTYTLVTDAASLAVGDEIVIVAAGSDYALSATQSSNNRPQAGVTKGDNTVTFGEDVQIITLEAGEVEGSFALAVTDGYLYAASSSKNYLRTQAAIDANASWTIAIADGIATVKAQGSYTRNWLRFNSSSKIFSCYGSGQMDISIYRLETAAPSDRVLESIAVVDPVVDYLVGDSLVEPKVTGTYSDGSTADVSSGCSFSNYDMDSADTYTVVVTHDETGITTSYEITVAEPLSVTLTLSENGKVTEISYEEGSEITLPEPQNATVGSYSFCGWTTSASVSEKPEELYAAGDTFEIGQENVTLYAVYAIGSGSASEDYVLTELADIEASDSVVITSTKSDGSVYAMSNSNGTSSAPSATAVTVEGNKLSAEPAENLLWNLSGDAAGFMLYPAGTTDSWLYCTASNNGVRVGTVAANLFTIDQEHLFHNGTGRYLGVYNAQDWRCYTTINTNISGQTLGFYVKAAGGALTGWTTTPSGEEIPTYTVSYGANTEDMVIGMPEAAEGILEGTEYSLSDAVPTREGYEFLGWGADPDATETIETVTVNADVTVYALWKEVIPPTTYSVSYETDMEGVTGMPENVTGIVEGTEYTLSDAIPTCPGYEFLGWTWDGAEIVTTVTVDRDIVVYALWKARTMSELFLFVDGYITNEYTCYAGEEITLTAPEATQIGSYTFQGWTESPTVDGKPADLYAVGDVYTMPDTSVTLYAVYAIASGSGSDSYVLTDVSQIQATDSVVITATKSDGSIYALSGEKGTASAPPAVAVTLDGDKLASEPAETLVWNLVSGDDGIEIYPAGTTDSWLYCTGTNNGVRVGTNAANLFAIDEASGYLKHLGTNRYLGVYNAQDWRCYTSPTANNIKDQVLGFYVKSAASLTGWTTAPDDTELSTYTLTYDANFDGYVENMPENVSDIIKGTEYILSDMIPTCYGLEFLGWGLSADATQPVTSVVMEQDTTVYALWREKKTYTVTFYIGDQTVTESYYEGDTIPASDIPEIESLYGASFVGWTAVNYEGELPTEQIEPLGAEVTGNLAYHALFSAGVELGSFKLSLTTDDGDTYYVGTQSKTYLVAVESADQAPEFGLEPAEGGYYVYYMDNGTKYYIGGEGTSTSMVSAHTEPTYVWTVRQDGESLTLFIGERYLGFNSGANPKRFTTYGNNYKHELTATPEISLNGIYTTNPAPMHTVNWYVDDEIYCSTKVMEDRYVSIPTTTPTKESSYLEYYDFYGWARTPDGEGLGEIFEMGTEDMAIYAVFRVNPYSYLVTLIEGDTGTLTVPETETVQPNLMSVPEREDLDQFVASWSSSDDTIATVDQNGVVTAVSKGTAVITVEFSTPDGTPVVSANREYTIELPIPDAPELSYNQLDRCTDQSFSAEYEYSVDHENWFPCENAPISVDNQPEVSVLYVRKAASEWNESGYEASVDIYAQPNLSEDIQVMFDGSRTIIIGLEEGREYELLTGVSASDTIDWSQAIRFTAVEGRNFFYELDKNYGQYMIRTLYSDERMEVDSHPLLREALLRQVANLSVSGNGTLTQTRTDGAYFPDEIFTVTAVPAEGEVFLGWTADGMDIDITETTLDLSLDAFESLVARFSGNAVGWTLINGEWHYYDENSQPVSGTVEMDINGVSISYELDETGKLVEEVWYTAEDGNLYRYYGPDCYKGVMRIIDGKTYFFRRGGNAAKGVYGIPETVEELSDPLAPRTFYLFDLETAALDRICDGFMTYGGETYYYHTYGSNQKCYGFYQIDGYYYYFSTSTGAMRTGEYTVKTYTSNGLLTEDRTFFFHEEYGYAVDAQGNPLTSLDSEPSAGYPKFVEKDGKIYYYKNAEGLAFGLQCIDGKYYYFSTSTGAMRTGEYTVMSYTSNGLLTENRTFTFDSTYGYAVDENGQPLTSLDAPETSYPKFVELNGKVYYYKSASALAFGLQCIDGKYYYLSTSTGAMRTGEYTVMSYTSNGLLTANRTFTFDSTYGYAVDENGQPITDLNAQPPVVAGYPKFVEKDGKTYYYKSESALAFGFQCIDGKYYYFSTSTGEMRTGEYNVKSYTSNGLLTEHRTFFFDLTNGYAVDENGNPLTGLN